MNLHFTLTWEASHGRNMAMEPISQAHEYMGDAWQNGYGKATPCASPHEARAGMIPGFVATLD